ncbi:hypothetical protein [Methylomonas sp. ZR1]|uniref:hypothetical protein n=1 Tax=Methylomonas sp. ZR1 TaxID=1797072 RepID=UPI0014932072|nr:hypothetical protein [Methylomonas sp. ZR1]NOV29186.1 hypothetical protein [Methylomonas sp. ZR1]
MSTEQEYRERITALAEQLTQLFSDFADFSDYKRPRGPSMLTNADFDLYQQLERYLGVPGVD